MRNRLRVIGALHGHELCLCQIVRVAGLSPFNRLPAHGDPPTVRGLVESQKLGRWTRFRLAGDDAAAADAGGHRLGEPGDGERPPRPGGRQTS